MHNIPVASPSSTLPFSSTTTGSITVTTATSSKGVIGSAVVTVADDLGNRVASVNVDGVWTISGRTYAATAKTGGTGSVTIRSATILGGTGFQFCVSALSRPGYQFDGPALCASPGAPALRSRLI